MVRFGLHALGIGAGADPSVVSAMARAAEEAGFVTLWAGEHVVTVDDGDSPYPYAADGRIAVPADADWLDPLAVLAYAAAVTSSIRLATGVLLLPEHHPVVVAKQAASLDRLSGGRFVLGVGLGWSEAEFRALGIPFDGRAGRTREYVAAMRSLWADDPASYHGDHVDFDRVRSHPKPAGGRVPVFLGGNTDRALARVAAYGDGWYGFNLPVDQVGSRVAALRSQCTARHRQPTSVEVAASLADGAPDDVAGLAAAGVDELVLVDAPPADPAEAADWVSQMADRWSVRPPAG